MICLSHDFKKITERKTQCDRRAAAACLHMDQSNENISNLEDPDSKVTYAAEVGEISKVEGYSQKHQNCSRNERIHE
ncbi:hypothetical protein Bca52824_086548 [Brassica carinata]|uniref:Uncharacterized protein n=1 Tax=Brassica carinata TaxID=52824 RepID=A0A8X7P990_BRACI|nr:hypothetical protein Bca52824_086548 [Brassica carinata]